jgi:geranylgeranyl pyrophosphate synthase
MSPADPSSRIARWQTRFEQVLAEHLPPQDQDPARLHQAMRYSALAGGKRFRPILVYATGEALGVDKDQLDPVAASIEYIHAYSLIHDDLPAMDDDDLRRGRPTCHRAFDEATAILAGDALQALAFEVLASTSAPDPGRALAVVAEVSRACGSLGMAGGQSLDLSAVGQQISVEALDRMHRLKTGALICAAVRAPCILASASAEVTDQLTAYADAIGLAFQVHDDILDVTGNPDLIGKPTLADSQRNKPTYPSVLGLPESREQARLLHQAALGHLRALDLDTTLLGWLADFVVSRDR